MAGRDFEDDLVPAHGQEQGHLPLGQVAQNPIQSDHEPLRRGASTYKSDTPRHTYSTKVV